MALLSRIEGFYLSILRIIILAAATIALVVVVLGFVRSAPLFAQQLGMGAAERQATGGDLSEFIIEKRADGVEISASEPSTGGAPAPPKAIKDAVALLARYDKERLGEDLNVEGAHGVLMERLEALPTEYQAAYGDSIKSLMAQLVASKGRPLQMEQINELINWHHQKFQANVEAKVAKRAADNVAAVQAMIISAAALLAFLLIVFCFIFVKIERNLRAVKVVERLPHAADPSQTVSA